MEHSPAARFGTRLQMIEQVAIYRAARVRIPRPAEGVERGEPEIAMHLPQCACALGAGGRGIQACEARRQGAESLAEVGLPGSFTQRGNEWRREGSTLVGIDACEKGNVGERARNEERLGRCGQQY